jgi:hypothetical protein
VFPLQSTLVNTVYFGHYAKHINTISAQFWNVKGYCVPGGEVNILGGHCVGHSGQKSVYVHVSYSERFPRYSYFGVQCTDEQHAMSSRML